MHLKPGSQDLDQPLFNTVNVMEMSGQEYGTMFDQDSLRVKLYDSQGFENIKLQYITTGHGGWDNGDEFNQKTNQIILDGKLIYSFTPWRNDCATYRKYNPASGNHGTALLLQITPLGLVPGHCNQSCFHTHKCD